MAVNVHDISVLIVKNGQININDREYSSRSTWDTLAISVELAVKKGDQIWNRRFYSGRRIVIHDIITCFLNTFILEEYRLN